MNTSFSGRDRCRLIGAVGLAIALRLALPLAALVVTRPQPPLVREPDSGGYVRLAENLVATGRFADRAGAEIERTPGYVCFLVPGVLAGDVDAITIALQCVAGGLTVYLTYALALVVFERRDVAFGAALFCACEPLSVLYTGKLLTETTFTCAITAQTFFLARYWRRRAWRDVLSMAVVLATAVYIRPIALYLPGLLTALIVIGLWRRVPRRRLVIQAAAFAALSAGLPAAWVARNEMVADYGGFSAMGDVNLYFWHAAGIEARRQGRPLDNVQRDWGYFSEVVFRERHPLARLAAPAERYAIYRREAWRILRESPGTALAVHLDGIRSTLFDAGTQAFRDYFRESPAAAGKPPPPIGAWARLGRALATRPLVVAIHAALQVTVIAYLLLALSGCLAEGHWRRPSVVLLVVTLVYFLVLSGGPAGYHRFRLPLVPILSVLAAAGWTGLLARRYKRVLIVAPA